MTKSSLHLVESPSPWTRADAKRLLEAHRKPPQATVAKVEPFTGLTQADIDAKPEGWEKGSGSTNGAMTRLLKRGKKTDD